MKCMQKKPDMRYMTASALIADLKRALIEPDGDYVVISDVVDDSPTIIMDKNEVDQLKKSAILAEKDRTVQPENEEEESDDDAIDPKLERILKICSGVVAVIIVLVVILLIGKVPVGGVAVPTRNKRRLRQQMQVQIHSLLRLL